MKIINPLYDKAFKYLMENEKLAKKVLAVILDVEIEQVKLEHQETVLPYERTILTLFRLDFKAIIKEPDGTRKTVLIELQKSKFSTDIQRFRNYLGSAYLSKPIDPQNTVEEPKVKYVAPYPIITIYILGYNLDDLPYMAVTVNRDIVNSVNKEKIEVKSFFIEHLTHQSHIIQVRRLPEKRRTKLEKFLVFFNQAWCTDDGYIIDLQEIPREFLDIARYLQGPLLDETFRRNLLAENQLDQIFGQQEAKFLKLMEEANEREKTERVLKEEAIKQKEEERRQKEEERRMKETFALKLARQMKLIGISTDEITNETGLRREEIARL